MYWWDFAARLVRAKSARRFGLITTNSIVQDYSRPVVERHIDDRQCPLLLVYAVTNHPWVENKDGAAVDVAMTVGANNAENCPIRITHVKGRKEKVELVDVSVPRINAALKNIPDVFAAKALKSNKGFCFQGVVPAGEGFKLQGVNSAITEQSAFRPYMIGDDLTDRLGHEYIIDFFGLSEIEAADKFPQEFSRLLDEVKPERDQNPRDSYKEKWWIFAEPRPNLRRAIAGLTRYVATPYTAVHRPFIFLDTKVIPDAMIYVIASDDALTLAVLSSSIHKVWCKYAGGTLQDRPRYNSDRTFLPFPFPDTKSGSITSGLRENAEKLDALRKDVLAKNSDLTMTKLYNVLEAARSAEKDGSTLSDSDRDIAVRGCVSLIRKLHDAIDSAVAEAYGWPADLRDEDILTRLVALNKVRAAEEAKGQIRWLRPDFQSPGAAAPQVNATLDLGDTPAIAPATVIPWPKTLAEQVSTVAAILAASQTPQHPNEIARAIKGTNAKGVAPVLDALAAIGQARKLADGRFAA